MATISNEVFLMSCINNSNNGKIDWNKVAKQCNMTTANAANCRFRRLRDTLDLSVLSSDQINTKNTPSPSKTPGRKRKATATPKKAAGSSASEDDEKDSKPQIKKRKKAQPDEPAFSHVKLENEETESFQLFS